jgi:hypothetical protein
MEKDDRQNGSLEQKQDSSEPQQASRPAPGKVTRTARLSAGRAPAVQRKPVAADGGGAPRARTAWEQTMDPWMDAAHRGLTALTARGEEPVQMRGEAEQPGECVHELAAQGISDASSSLPHLDRIQRSFGAHDVSDIEAHAGGPAVQATEGMGAQAYATGNHVAFGTAPDLHTAAHEAAHVVQQRAGVQLYGGVGQRGDAYERHADAVADLVVQGKSAEGLLDSLSGAGDQEAVQQAGTDVSAPGTTRGGVVQRNEDSISSTESFAAFSEAQRNFLQGQGIDPAGLDPATAQRLGRLLRTAEQAHRALETGDVSAVSAGPDVAVTAHRTISDAGAEISVMILAEGSSLLISQRFDLATGTVTRQFAYQDAGGDRMEAQSTSAPQILQRFPIEPQALQPPESPEIRIGSPEGTPFPESHAASTSDEALDEFDDLLPPEDAETGSSEGVGSFLEGAVLGDAGDNDSWSAIAGQTVIGFVPIAGQVADVRDLLASFRGVAEGRSGAWLNVAIAGVAFIPGLDFLKGGTRVGRRALREGAEESITEVSEASLKRMRRVLSRQAVETARRRLRALAAGRIELMQRLTELMEHPGLRSRTRDFVADARNAIRDHMTPQDLSGALRDRLGMPVRRSGSERTYDHLHEVRDTLRGMEKARRALLGELQRLEPGSEGFRVVSRDLDAMAEMQRRVHEFLETR